MIARLKGAIGTQFFRNVLILAGGTAFAQGLTVLILPVLTRLYSPSDFSTLAVYASILAIMGSVACFRYEIAISLPKSKRDGLALLVLAVLSATLWSLVTAVVLYWFGWLFLGWINNPELVPFLWLIPLGIWLQGIYTALQYWATREKDFGRLSRTKLNQSIAGAVTQIVFGWLKMAPSGLLFGHFLSTFAGSVGLAIGTIGRQKKIFNSISYRRLYKVGCEYSHFPKYSALESLANSAAMQLPLILIAASAAVPEAGYLLLATRVMAVPMALIGNSISQVYLSGAAHQLRDGTLSSHTASIISALVKSGAGPLIFAGITAPLIFKFVFGAEWQRAGELISWMTPWFLMQFLSSPISMVLHVTKNHRMALVLQMFGLIVRVGFVILAMSIAPEFVSEFYAISGFVFYGVYFIVVVRTSAVSIKNFPGLDWVSLKVISLWIIFGFLVNLAMG